MVFLSFSPGIYLTSFFMYISWCTRMCWCPDTAWSHVVSCLGLLLSLVYIWNTHSSHFFTYQVLCLDTHGIFKNPHSFSWLSRFLLNSNHCKSNVARDSRIKATVEKHLCHISVFLLCWCQNFWRTEALRHNTFTHVFSFFSSENELILFFFKLPWSIHQFSIPTKL